MMDVLWVNTQAAPQGGCERYIRDTAGLLRERGVRSTLLYDVTSRVDADFVEPFDRVFPAVDIARQVRELAPDLVYVHQVPDVSWIETLAAVEPPVLRFFHDHKLFCLREHKYRTLGRETCTQPTGFNCYTCLGFLGRGFRVRRLGTLEAEQRLNARLDGFVVGSRYMAEHVEAHGFARDKIHVAPLFARPPAPPPHKVERESDVLLMVGQLTRGKAVDVALDAVERTGGRVRLRIAGSGPLEAELKERARPLGARVEFLGRLGRDELETHYRRAAGVVFCSRTPETFGLVGPEAMSHGTPVIATRVGGIEEWLQHEATGLAVPPGDADALAQAMDRIVSQPELARRLGDKALRRYREHFTPQQHGEKLLRLFKRETKGTESNDERKQRVERPLGTLHRARR